ncbi:CD99 antigen-like protein 2 isoform X2 [Spea bombifrons]|uniref:CD99 antigen-like protein 2 isoform X2 n=1 Tax=Spea bombifrons TaxID=233779 RepID=UPI00234A19AC|nr:CD99 antigen-like protein 2 isoform X2 [Spea bombifrons]
MAKGSVSAVLALALLAVTCRVYGDSDDFNLEDAFSNGPTEKPKPKPPKIPANKPIADDDLDLLDFFDTPSKPTTKPPRPAPRPPPKKQGDDLDLADFFDTPSKPTTKPPRPAPRPPPKKPDPNDFDLGDALKNNNDGKDISDSDLEDIFNDGYNPDKKKGGGGRAAENNDHSDTGSQTETMTIAGIASGLAMALIGAVSSYISYQQKKFCFSIQEGLNANYVKGEQMEGVVSEEPPVKHSFLETQASAPEDAAKV